MRLTLSNPFTRFIYKAAIFYITIGIIANFSFASSNILAKQSANQTNQSESMPGVMIDLRASGRNEFTRVIEPPQRWLAPRTGVIDVNYIGSWSPQAQTAFQYSVYLWELHIVSPVVITIDARWEALGTDILGSAGSISYERDFTGAPRATTWYPSALANALHGADLNPSQSDIRARFSSAFPNWYFGTDGRTPTGQYDFVSVVLHEIGHGLGFAGSGTVSNSQGSWGGGTPYPLSYDVYTENGVGTDTINTSVFPNPSAALASHLQSNNLYFNGVRALAANGGTRPQLYAPTSFQGGSSYSHLNESTYVAGSPNSLMTPQIGTAEAIHSLGAITLGILNDIGWQPNTSSDIVLQHQIDRRIGIWRMNGNTVMQGTEVDTVPEAGWKAVSTGHFNGDGILDIVLQHQMTREIGIWLMNGSTIMQGTTVAEIPIDGWKVVGTGNFNGDGTSDLVIQHQLTREIGIWLMNGTTLINGTVINQIPEQGWKVVGAGKFNSDGTSDIVIQHQLTREIGIWLMNGTTLISGTVINQIPADGWKVVGIGNFNGDGSSDIVLQQQTTRQIGIWLMDGTSLVQSITVDALPEPGWRVIGSDWMVTLTYLPIIIR